MLDPGDVVAGYRVVRRLGVGGMGEVYLAQHPRLPRQDAVKILRADVADAELRARFEREGAVVGALSHPNIVTVHDRGEHDGRLWIAMQHVVGGDVDELLTRAPGGLDPLRAVRIIREVASGLDHAHGEGVLHRDVKPANILLGPHPRQPERVLLSDFGIAKILRGEDAPTRAGRLLLTRAYAAPEQWRGEDLDQRTDVYALGCVLHTLLTGRSPFSGWSDDALVHAHLREDAPRPSQVRAGVPPSLDAVCARAMAKDRGRRYSSCGDLARDASLAVQALERPPQRHRPPDPRPPLRRTAPVPPPTVHHDAPVPASPRSRRGRRFVAPAAAGLAVAVGVAAAVQLTGADPGDAAGTTPDAPVPTRPTWGPLTGIVTTFPAVLPATPDGRGHRGASCSSFTSTHDVHTVGALQCTDGEGVTFYVFEYPDALARAARADELARIATAEPRPFGRAGGRQGTRYDVTASSVGAASGVYLTFSDPGLTTYSVYAEWADHDPEEIFSEWFATAPF